MRDDEPIADAEVSEVEQAAAWLERLTRDPLVDAVPARLTVVRASDPAPRGRYQECELELEVTLPGRSTVRVTHAAVFPRSLWPRAGDVVPARVSVSHPEVFEAQWERLREQRNPGGITR